jgi:hypothetical protein
MTTTPDLPVPVADARTYLRVRPTDDALAPETVRAHARRLHQLGRGGDTGLFNTLLSRNPLPIIECLIVSDGNPDAPLSYLFGIDDAEALDALERVLRGLFPDSYELEHAARTKSRLDGFHTDTTDVAAVEYHGRVERRRDWQTCLTPFAEFHGSEHARVPLATVVETMAEYAVPMVYQALLCPQPDWSHDVEERRLAIEENRDTLTGRLTNAVFGPPEEDALTVPASDERRLAELTERNARRSFVVNARVVVGRSNESSDPAETAHDDANPTRIARELASVFADVSHTCYEIEGELLTDETAQHVLEEIRDRTLHLPSYERFTNRVPWRRARSRGIVADAGEVGCFCLLGGPALTAAGSRVVVPTPGERTALPRPPAEQLAAYRDDGLLLGHPLTQDAQSDTEPLVLPPQLQPLHVGWFGKTGSGKSTSLINAILENHAATQGADILIDPKGDGMGVEYLRAHYATYGTLENVLYFDCAAVLPALSFFDIRDELDAGVPRTTAVEDTVDHYLEILTQIMGRDRFDQAVRSPDIIRYLAKAMFDPVNGYDAYAHRDLHNAVRVMHERQAAPAVADPDLERMLAGVAANRPRSFDEIMQGVANRMEKIPVDRRLARVFNHVPEPGDPHFDLADYLDEDVVIVLDTGELRSEAQRVLTLVILSNLWTALRRRSKRTDGESPLVNLYVEEAASVAVSDLLKQLLAQSRGFDCSVTLSMQFPAQLRGHSDAVYDEVLNNISTFVTGNVPVDQRLAERLATDDMNPQAVGNRLRALRRGQWLVSLPAAFDDPEPRPFLVRSASPPPGDPAGDDAFSQTEESAFATALETVEERTRAGSGLTLGAPSPATREDEQDDTDDDGGTELPETRVDSLLPHTNRMPPTVEYAPSLHALRCRECRNRYDPDIEGMRRAITCCSSLDDVDPSDVPVCDLNLKLKPEERVISEWSDQQLMFLQAVYNAQQLRYDPLEYDLLHDSMIRLQEYVGIEAETVQDLVDADILRHESDHPHRLYTVTPDGRNVIGESYRQGVDYGHGSGDLEESSEHVFAVELARRYLEQEYVQDSESSVTEVVPYYDLDDQHRLDLAGLDEEGDIVVAVEAERLNHDVRRAVADDFDKIAACDVEEAIWVVMTQQDGHAVLEALNDPLEGEPRVEKTYAETTPTNQFRIDTPGMTAVYAATWLRSKLDQS